MAPSSQESEPPENPVRFKQCSGAPGECKRQHKHGQAQPQLQPNHDPPEPVVGPFWGPLLYRPRRLAESAQASCTSDNQGDAVGTPANESAAWDGSDTRS